MLNSILLLEISIILVYKDLNYTRARLKTYNASAKYGQWKIIIIIILSNSSKKIMTITLFGDADKEVKAQNHWFTRV